MANRFAGFHFREPFKSTLIICDRSLLIAAVMTTEETKRGLKQEPGDNEDREVQSMWGMS